MEVRAVFAYRAVTVFGGAFQRPSTNVRVSDFLAHPSGPTSSYNPASTTAWAYHMSAVWAIPRSLATTQGIAIAFYSSGYLDASVPPLASLKPTLARRPSVWSDGI